MERYVYNYEIYPPKGVILSQKTKACMQYSPENWKLKTKTISLTALFDFLRFLKKTLFGG